MSAEPEDSFVSGVDEPERYNAIMRSRNPMTSNLDPASLEAARKRFAELENVDWPRDDKVDEAITAYLFDRNAAFDREYARAERRASRAVAAAVIAFTLLLIAVAVFVGQLP